MPPRKSHRKSRAGCRRCKARKIKCDEIHPRCGNCVKHGVTCDFENPAVIEVLVGPASPSASNQAASPASFATPLSSDSRSPIHDGLSPNAPPLAPLCRPPATVLQSGMPSANNRMLELRLMHHYTAVTSKTLTGSSASTQDVWMVEVPRLAFEGATYLTDAMLAIAALHLRSQSPDDKALMQASHAYMASSLAAYCNALRSGIDQANSEALFLTASLIAFQSTATRVFARDEPRPDPKSTSSSTNPPTATGYSPPLSTFHAFQGVKAVVVSSWQWIRHSTNVLSVIDAQPALELDLNHISPTSFFGGLLEGLDEELTSEDEKTALSSGDAYRHAVSVLNWAHRSPYQTGCLAFPATVARRFVDLLELRRPRALVILATFFALLRRVEHLWWVDGIPRREVLGIVSMFEQESPWWRHLDWPLQIVLCEGPIPPDLWGSEFAEPAQEPRGLNSQTFVEHIEVVSRMMASRGQNTLPGIPPILGS